MTNKELFAKLNTLSRDELLSYQTAANSTQRFLNIAGVSSLLTILMFTNIITVALGVFVVYLLGHMSANVENTKEHIEKLLSRMPKDQINS